MHTNKWHTDIYQLPPGHYAVIPLHDVNSMKVCRYWDLDYQEKDLVATNRTQEKTESQVIREVRQLLDEAIRHRLKADGGSLPFGWH